MSLVGGERSAVISAELLDSTGWGDVVANVSSAVVPMTGSDSSIVTSLELVDFC